jgi:hypothetical protein
MEVYGMSKRNNRIDQVQENSFFCEEDMSFYRSLRIALFLGFAFWKDSAGTLYRVDCQNDENGRIILPRFGTGLLWENNLLRCAAESILFGNGNHPWPFGFHGDDDFSIPWNRWVAVSDEEKAAEYTTLI